MASAIVAGIMGVLSVTSAAAAQTVADDEPSRPAATTNAPSSTNAPSKFRSPEDGWLDLSGFTDQTYGFVPLVIPITEPAVGYAAVIGWMTGCKRWSVWLTPRSILISTALAKTAC